ncbi:MAG: hypothetical protein DCF26_19025 [Burkholderiales bacterium]|nr:MAG: hypothetical protein DCF26_19025 [Burkholderiales bacterium]
MHNFFTPEELEEIMNFQLEPIPASEEQLEFDRAVLLEAEGLLSPVAATPPRPLTPAIVGPTQRISIRLPHHVIEATKREAARQGIPYQTLINHLLATASVRW